MQQKERSGKSTEENDLEPESLKDAVQQTLDEARMVLPGIQALFGFQLIAVFNQRFADLPQAEQYLHLAAIAFTALAVALVMTPAAYHRQREPRRVTARFLALASAFVTWAMVPLACALGLDLYVVARVVTDSVALAMSIAGGLAAVIVALWFVYPRLRR